MKHCQAGENLVSGRGGRRWRCRIPGRLPGAIHWPQDRQEREILGPLSEGPHTMAPKISPAGRSPCCASEKKTHLL